MTVVFYRESIAFYRETVGQVVNERLKAVRLRPHEMILLESDGSSVSGLIRVGPAFGFALLCGWRRRVFSRCMDDADRFWLGPLLEGGTLLLASPAGPVPGWSLLQRNT